LTVLSGFLVAGKIDPELVLLGLTFFNLNSFERDCLYSLGILLLGVT